MMIRLKRPIVSVGPHAVLMFAAVPGLYQTLGRMSTEPARDLVSRLVHWSNACQAVNEVGKTMVDSNFLTDFKAVCDATTNPPETALDSLRMKILVKVRGITGYYAGMFTLRRVGTLEIEVTCEDEPMPDIVSAVGALECS